MTSRSSLFRRSTATLVSAVVACGVVLATPIAASGSVLAGAPTTAQLLMPTDVGFGSEPVPADTSVMAVHAATRTTVDVTDFGADRLGKKDSAKAINDAVLYAKSLQVPTTITFPQGIYQIYPEQTPKRELYVSNTSGADAGPRIKNIGLLIEDMQDVVIDGQGSQLLYHGKQTQFAVIRSENVTLRDLETDWVAPGTVDIIVVSSGVEAGKPFRVVQVPPGTGYRIEGGSATFTGEKSPYTDQAYWSFSPGQASNGWNQIRHLATGETFRSGVPLWSGATSVAELPDNQLRITYSGTTNPGGAGDVYEMRDSYRDTPGGFIWESTNTDLIDLGIHYLHGFGIVAQLTTNVTLDGVQMKTDPGTWRQTSSFADFLQMSGVAGKVQILNSLFDNPQDDPINVHGTYVQVKGVNTAANSVTLQYMHNQTAGFPQFYPGDTLRFVTKSTMLPMGDGQFTVKSVDGPTGLDHNKNLTQMTVVLNEPLPAGLAVDAQVAENLTYTPEVHIAGNTFTSVPARGILVTTPKPVLIERNLFDQMDMASIYVSADARSWYESGGANGLTIRGNVFDRPATDAPVIFFDPTNTGTVAGKAVHNNVLIDGNKFALLPGTELLRGKSVSDLTFSHNAVTHYAPTTTPDPAASSSTALFSFTGSRVVKLSDNTYEDGFNLRVNTDGPSTAEISGNDPVKVNQDNLTTAPQAALAPGLSWTREDSSRWSATDLQTVSLTSGANGLWATQNGASNILLKDLAGGQVSTEIVVKMDGATQSSYEEAGPIVYVNDDNYVTLQRKYANGSPVIAVVTEANGSPNESTKITDPGGAVMWLKLTRSGNTFTGSYSTDGVQFTGIGTITNAAVATGAGRSGVMAAGPSNRGTAFTFSGLTVDGHAVPFFTSVPAAPRLAAALKDVTWSGVEFGDPTGPRTWLTAVGRATTSVSARFPTESPNTKVVVTLNSHRVAVGSGGDVRFPLTAGPNVIEVRTVGAAGASQTYRWVVISDRPGTVAGHASALFSDVGINHPFYEDVQWAAQMGIATGYEDGTFQPLADVQRQAVAAFLYRAEHPGGTPAACTSKPFDDVAVTNIFCPQIAWMKQVGLAHGTVSGAKTLFKPGVAVSRQDISAFLYRLKNQGQDDPTCADRPFLDVPADSQFCGVITWMKTNEYSLGYTDGRFRPGIAVKRDATVAFLHRVYAP